MSKRGLPTSSDAKKRAELPPITIPVHAETVTVQRRRSERARVRMTKTVKEEQVPLDLPSVMRDVVIERVPIDRFVERPAGPRQEGETLVIPVYEEVPVVVMKTKLREEVRVTTRVKTMRRRTHVAVHREQVSVDRLPRKSDPQVTSNTSNPMKGKLG